MRSAAAMTIEAAAEEDDDFVACVMIDGWMQTICASEQESVE
jgi:hypothetical protein